MEYVTMNLKVKDSTSRALGVVKEMYGLKDKGQALDKFADMYGSEFVEREVKEEVVRELIKSSEAHIKKYGFKPMTKEELRELCGA